MPQSPQSASQCCTLCAALVTDDGRDGNDVVGVGRVPHAKKKTDGDNGKQSKHVIRPQVRPVILPFAN